MLPIISQKIQFLFPHISDTLLTIFITSMIEGLRQWTLAQIEEYGLPALGLFSYTEAIFHPIPVDPMLVGMVALQYWHPFTIFIIATVTSSLGGITSYILGKSLGKPVVMKFITEERFQQGEQLIHKWGILSILISAITPIPFKVVTWLAGILRMHFLTFFLAQTIGRAIRFALVIWGFEYISQFF